MRIPLKERFEAKVERVAGVDCWIWTADVNQDGYGRIGEGGWYGKHVSAHRVSYELYIGPIPEGLLVCHKCDTPSCVRPDHLFLGTKKDNALDMVAKGRGRPGRARSGEKHHLAKLTQDKAALIRADGRLYREIAGTYGVSLSTISQVKLGKRWI